MSEIALKKYMRNQKPKTPGMKGAPTFLRNLEEALDAKRSTHSFLERYTSPWKTGDAIDFCSNDLMSLSKTGHLRAAFLEELAKHPDFSIHSGGSRLTDGNYDYIEQVEAEIAEFHGAEAALLLNSGWEANSAIYSTIPRPGDAIIYDELIHASIHDGMVHSLSLCKLPFRHNDVDALREVLTSVVDTQPLIKQGERSIIISVESVYSMDGDVCPLVEMLQIAQEVCPLGNAVFFVDEAHSTGTLGPNGRGLVSKLGLEKQIAIRNHSYGKALACTGATVLANNTVRNVLLNYARPIIYTTAPPFPVVASIRAGYNLLKSDVAQQRVDNIQHLVRHFFTLLERNPIWEKASELGILWIPLMENWESREWMAHMVPLWTRPRYHYWLTFHLQLSGICAFPIQYPTVPKGKDRVRFMFHGGNTEAEVEMLAKVVIGFAQEMIGIEAAESEGVSKVPINAQRVYALMAQT